MSSEDEGRRENSQQSKGDIDCLLSHDNASVTAIMVQILLYGEWEERDRLIENENVQVTSSLNFINIWSQVEKQRTSDEDVHNDQRHILRHRQSSLSS